MSLIVFGAQTLHIFILQTDRFAITALSSISTTEALWQVRMRCEFFIDLCSVEILFKILLKVTYVDVCPVVFHGEKIIALYISVLKLNPSAKRYLSSGRKEYHTICAALCNIRSEADLVLGKAYIINKKA